MKHLKFFTALLIILSILFGCFSAVSAENLVTLNGFSFYTDDNGDAVIVGYDEKSERADIPYSLLGAKVTKIANNAFWNNSALCEISFEKASGLRKIGSNAFYNCTALTSVTLPHLDELGFGAFRGCTGLKTLTVNKGLISIPAQAFESCENLTSVTLENTITSIGEYAFGNCKSLVSINIPDSVTEIGEYAFGYYYDDKNDYVKAESFKIYGYSGTAAKTYAEKNGFEFICLGEKPVQHETNVQETAQPVTETPARDSVQPEKTDISNWTVSGINNKTYTGKAIKQNIVVSNNKKKAVFNTNYKNNINAGTASVTIMGKGDYKGKITKTFKILKAKNPIKVTSKAKFTAKMKKKTTVKKAVTVKKAQGKVTYKTDNKKVTLKSGNLIIAKGFKKGKTYKVKVIISAKGNKNYKAGKAVKTIMIKVK